MQVAADRAGVAGLADAAHPLAGPDALAAMHGSGADHVGVEVAAPLALAVDQQEVAVEDGVVASAQDASGRGGDQGRVAGGDDVEALVGAPTAAWRAELADVAARPVRAGDREDVGAELRGAVVAQIGGRRRRERRQQGEACEEGAPQWCSMTRSTMLYSFASSAVMK